MTWQQALGLALGGMPLGAMYALQAMGIVLVYKTSKVFNFAQGAIGMMAAFVASSIGVDLGLPMPIAVLGALVFGGLLGVVIEATTIRRIEGQLQRTVATLGWLLLLQAAAQFVYGAGSGQQPVLSVFPNRYLFGVDAIGLFYGYDTFGVLVVAALVALGLGVFFRRSSFGTAMRAVADAPEGASILGIDVNFVTLVSWALGAGLAALSGVLVAPLLGALDTVGLVVLTIQALAAALVGRLDSLPLTFVGGLALGMSQPVLIRLLRLPPVGGRELIALVFVLVALLARRQVGRRDVGGSGLPPVALAPMPRGRWAALFVGSIGVVLLLQAFVLPAGSDSRSIAQAAIWSIGILSLVLLAGVAGQVSLCQATFMGIGGFVAAIALNGGVPFVVSIVVGGLGAAAVAGLVGLPALRLKELELAIVTLSLAFAADRYFFGGFTPLIGPDRSRPFPRPAWADGRVVLDGIEVTNWRPYAVLSIVAFVVLAWAVASLRRGRTGGAFTALRSSEAATSAMGYSLVSVKLQGFALSGFVAGIGGALFAGLNVTASGNAFMFDRSITLLAFAVIAGIGSVPGAVVGGLIIALSATGSTGSEVANDNSAALNNGVTAALLIVTLVVSPRGLADLLARGRRWLSARVGADDDAGPDGGPGEPELVWVEDDEVEAVRV